MKKEQALFNIPKLAILLLCFLFTSTNLIIAQNNTPTLTLETINDFKNHYQTVTEIKPQTIAYKDSYFLRFPELGAIYNPTFPNTRNRVHCENFQKEGNSLSYIGFSNSTNRASVKLKGRVGEFYSIWKGKYCSSLIEYKVTRNGDNLEVTGKIYQCVLRA